MSTELDAPLADTPAETPPEVETPAVEAVALEPDSGAAAEDPAPVADAAVEKPKHHGAVAELMAGRKLLAEVKAQKEAIEQELQTYRQRMAAGELLPAPPRAREEAAEAEQVREQEEMALELGLLKADGTPDLAAAARAIRAIDKRTDKAVSKAVAPLQSQVVTSQAQSHRMKLNEHLATQQMPEEAKQIVRETYEEVLQQPNGAYFLTQPGVSQMLWERAAGRAALAGKMGAVAPAPAVKGAPPIPPEVGGRRSVGSTVVLSPKLAQVYKDSGLDPSKGWTASNHKPGGQALE